MKPYYFSRLNMLKPGLYEQVVNKEIANAISVHPDLLSITESIDETEAPKILSDYIASILEKGLSNIGDRGSVDAQVRLVNSLVSVIAQATDEIAFDDLSVDEEARQLLALIEKRDSIHAVCKKTKVIRPETSMAQSSLFTGAVHEPSMMMELKKEIASSDHIDMLVSFIKWSGLRLLIDEIEKFTKRGGKLRVITTSYMGATDAKAIEELSKLENTEIKISYDTKRRDFTPRRTCFIVRPGSTLHMSVRPIYLMLLFLAD